MGRLDEIAQRNQRALRQRHGMVGELVDDIFDRTQPPADRRRKLIALAAAVAILAAIAIIVVLQLRGSDEAPGGKVRSATGEAVELSKSWSKRRVIVEFYPNRDLDYTRERLAALERARPTLDADIVGVVGLSSSHVGQVAEQAKIGFPLYGDHAFTVIPEWGLEFKAAGATGPATFVVEPGGKISYRKIGEFAPIGELPRKR